MATRKSQHGAELNYRISYIEKGRKGKPDNTVQEMVTVIRGTVSDMAGLQRVLEEYTYNTALIYQHYKDGKILLSADELEGVLRVSVLQHVKGLRLTKVPCMRIVKETIKNGSEAGNELLQKICYGG